MVGEVGAAVKMKKKTAFGNVNVGDRETMSKKRWTAAMCVYEARQIGC